MEERNGGVRAARLIAAVALATGFLLGPIRSATPQVPGGSSKIAGVGMTRPGVPLDQTLNDLPRMKAAGINSVMIDVWEDVSQDDGYTTIKPGDITTPPDQLRDTIVKARTLGGMQVYFMPKLWCPKCSHTWRGIIQPNPRTTFYANYQTFIRKYADLARSAGANVFVIGSEMNSTQNDDLQDGRGPGAPWRDVAQTARDAFQGKITYDANWDTVSEVKFWDAVDVVSVSAYNPLLDDDRPSVSQIRQGWQSSQDVTFAGRKWFNELQTVATSTGKQIIFGEVGYLSSTKAGERPYDPSDQHEYSDAVQTNFYQGLLETFEGQSWWGGVFWWEWYTDQNPQSSMSYTPRDKMTEQFLKAWYVDGWRGGEYSSTVGSTTTTTAQGATTTTTQPSSPPPPTYKNPPPNSAPIIGPSTPPPAPPPTYTSPPPTYTSPPPTYTSPQPIPPPSSSSPYSPAPPTVSPTPPPAFIPNSAPVIESPHSTTTPTFAPRSTTTTTTPPTTTTTVAQQDKIGASTPSNAGLPPTGPVFSPTPVVARTYGDTGSHNSRAQSFLLGAISILVPTLGAILAIIAGQNHDERMRRKTLGAAPLYAWQQAQASPAPRRPQPGVRPVRLGSRPAIWPRRQPGPRRPAHRRASGLRRWFQGH